MDFDQDLNSSVLMDLLAAPLSALEHPGGGSCLGNVPTEGASAAACCILWILWEKPPEPIQDSPSTIDKRAAVTSNQWPVNSLTNPPTPSPPTRLINNPGN